MGTNHYFVTVKKCPTCGCGDVTESIHMGKSSAGWYYTMRSHPDKGIFDFIDWLNTIERVDGFIEDEYGNRLTAEEWISKVCERRRTAVKVNEEYLSREFGVRWDETRRLYYTDDADHVVSDHLPYVTCKKEFC